MDLATITAGISKIVGFLSDAITVVIGTATIYAFFKYRKKFSALLRLLRFNHINDRVSEIKLTLDLVDQCQIPKGRAIEVRALFGRLNGQLLPLCDLVPELHVLQQQADSIAHSGGRLTEPIKKQFVYQTIAQIEASKLTTMNELVAEDARG